MMKKFSALFLTLTFVVLCAATALAGSDSTYYAVVNNPDPADRLNLRMTPSRDSTSVGKYFNGTIVRVLQEVDENWAQVQVGYIVGYMMRTYLTDPMVTAVASATVATQINSPYADEQWLLDRPGSEANPLLQLQNGTPVVILGVAEDFAHVQAQGITGYVPLTSVPLNVEKEAQASEDMMPIPDPLTGSLLGATLVMDDVSVQLTEADKLQSLQSMLVSREYWGYRIAGCPIGATLTLTYQEGQSVVIELATDSCCIYRHDGHDFYYARNQWAAEGGLTNTVLFDLFGIALER